jgi:DNA-binding SARP family transcriptional activator
MQVRLLGPVELSVGGTPVPVVRRNQRLLLALLAVHANRSVSLARIIDVLWESGPPPTARNQVHVHVSQLRRLLGGAGAGSGPVPLATTPTGYQLNAPPVAVDLLEFAARRTDADRLLAAGETAAAGRQLRAALELWQGAPLGGLAGRFADAEAARLRQSRLAALERRIDVDLVLGRHAQITDELAGLVTHDPTHEGLRRRLMLALHQSGRTAEALAVYRDGRRLLVETHGIEPGAALRETEAALLRGEPAEPLISRLLPARPGPPAAEPAGLAVPAQLPGDVYGFAGRAAYLTQLDGLLTGAGDGADRPAAAVIASVSGTAGVGKTALAVHWAHQVAARFPDGQLYVNLRGFDPGGQVLDPAAALRGILDSLGVPANRVPDGLDAQVALYRSLLAGKRTLVVLDNARDAEQVRPLLPASPTTFAVVTSRNSLTGLVAADGAHPVTLDLLPPDEARELLARRLPGRVLGEPAAVDAIVAACARLPLALSITAARARQSSFPLAHLAGELADATGRLGALDAGDPATHVRAVFSWSYRALTPGAARLFRLLGRHLGPDISAPAAASLAGQPLPETRPLLTELTRANLVSEHAPGRYTCHDLLAAYATELAEATDPAGDRRAATGRLLDHYAHTAYAAARLHDPARPVAVLPLVPPADGVTPERLAGQEDATAWLTTEQPVLLAAVRLAAGCGFDTHTWQLAWAPAAFLNRSGHWHEWAAVWQAALPAADRLGPPAASYAHRELAQACTLLGRYPQADAHFRRALELYVAAGDRLGQAHIHYALALLSDRRGQPEQSLEHGRQALPLFEATGDHRGQAIAHNAIGWSHVRLGDHATALTHCQLSVALFQQVGDRWGEAAAWDRLGFAHHHLGQHGQAVDCYRHALDLFRELGSRFQEARTLHHLGDTHQAAADPAAARTAWTAALAILADLNHPEADTLRGKLA